MAPNNTKPASTRSTSAQRAISLQLGTALCHSRAQSCCVPGTTPAAERRRVLHFCPQHRAEVPSPST